MTIRYFCTLFDSNYLLKGVAMIRSLARCCTDLKVYVLCIDEQTKHILERLNMPYVSCVALSDVENEELLRAKRDRGIVEYYWTLSSCFTWYVMQNHTEIDFLTYIDADLLFFSDVQPLYDEIGDASIAIIEHRFSSRLKHLEVNGRFCVEWVSFRRDDQGLACLSRWREQCIEWCYYRLEDGKFGDQKYLDAWPSQYSGCHIIMHKGAGVAPWNYSQYTFGQNGTSNITVCGVPLIFYHFHQFQILTHGKFDRLSAFYTSECPEPAGVYEIYESELKICLSDVRSVEPRFTSGLKPFSKVLVRRLAQQYVPRWVKEVARRIVRY